MTTVRFFLFLFAFPALLGAEAYEHAVRKKYREGKTDGSVHFYSTVELSPECLGPINELWNLAADYGNLFAFNKEKKANIKHDEYMQKMEQMSPQCRDEALGYISMQIAYSMIPVANSDEAIKLSKLLHYVVNKKMIRALDAKERNLHAELSDPKILGAYSCKENKIWLSSDLRPLNLGAVFFHELDHWARSLAFEHMKQKERLHLLPDTLKNEKSFYLYDETLSSINSAYVQMSTRNEANRNSDHLTFIPNLLGIRFRPRYLDFDVVKKYYKLNSDLNLYNRRGQLVSLWSKEVFKTGVVKGLAEDKFLSRHILHPNSKEAEDVFKIVESVYSPESNQTIGPLLYKDLVDNPGAIDSLNSPIRYLLSLDSATWEYLDAVKGCDMNSGERLGGEGVGVDHSKVRLNTGIKACLEPVKQL